MKTFLFESAPVDERALLREVEAAASEQCRSPLNWEWVREMNRSRGTDFASLFLREWCRRNPQNGAFWRAFSAPPPPAPSAAPRRVVLLPSMFYREHPELGGDGALFQRIAPQYGVAAELIPLRSLGSVEQNADILLEDFSRRRDPVWVISFSKGSADFKRALARGREVILPKLAGWLNIAGTVGGTHMTEKGAQNPIKQLMLKSWIRLRGGAAGLIEEMDWSHPFSRAAVSLPPAVKVINLLGLPLCCHLRKPLVSTYQYLSTWGPNEGFLVFEDAVSIGGFILPLWGADHYLHVPELSEVAHHFFQFIRGAP